MRIRIAGFGEVTVDIEYLCECNCEKEPLSPKCNDKGTYKCGICECPEGFFGSFCQCDASKVSFILNLIHHFKCFNYAFPEKNIPPLLRILIFRNITAPGYPLLKICSTPLDILSYKDAYPLDSVLSNWKETLRPVSTCARCDRNFGFNHFCFEKRLRHKNASRAWFFKRAIVTSNHANGIASFFFYFARRRAIAARASGDRPLPSDIDSLVDSQPPAYALWTKIVNSLDIRYPQQEKPIANDSNYALWRVPSNPNFRQNQCSSKFQF